jgi:hypothetical protein
MPTFRLAWGTKEKGYQRCNVDTRCDASSIPRFFRVRGMKLQRSTPSYNFDDLRLHILGHKFCAMAT